MRCENCDLGTGSRIRQNVGGVVVAAPEVTPVVRLGREQLDGGAEGGKLWPQHLDEIHHLRAGVTACLVVGVPIRFVLGGKGVHVEAALLLIIGGERREQRGPGIVAGRIQAARSGGSTGIRAVPVDVVIALHVGRRRPRCCPYLAVISRKLLASLTIRDSRVAHQYTLAGRALDAHTQEGQPNAVDRIPKQCLHLGRRRALPRVS